MTYYIHCVNELYTFEDLKLTHTDPEGLKLPIPLN